MDLFQDFLNKLQRALGTSALHPDAHHACLLHFREEGVELLFEYDDRIVPQSVIVTSPIGVVSAAIARDLLEEALKENGVRETALAFVPEQESLFLFLRIPLFLEEAEVARLVHTCCAEVLLWRQRLESFVPEHVPKQGSSSTPFLPQFKA